MPGPSPGPPRRSGACHTPLCSRYRSRSRRHGQSARVDRAYQSMADHRPPRGCAARWWRA
eukprot:scaffold14591_cov65-Phaeocystis_antarctica.AAC.3